MNGEDTYDRTCTTKKKYILHIKHYEYNGSAYCIPLVNNYVSAFIELFIFQIQGPRTTFE